MDRHLVAYLLIAALLAALIVVALRVRYNSRSAVLKRRRHAERARSAARREQHTDSAD